MVSDDDGRDLVRVEAGGETNGASESPGEAPILF